MNTKERLIQYIERKKMKVAQFEQLCGLSNGYIRNSKGSIGTKKLEDILNSCPDLNREWLIQGTGDMLITNIINKDKEPSDVYYTYLLPQSAMGGSLVGFGADGVFPENCELVISPIAGVDFAITIYGDSMIPEYQPGSRVLVKRIDPNAFIAWGNVYVLDTINGLIVKELQPSDSDGRIICHSHNPSGRYKDFDVHIKDIRGIYRVLACVTAK